MGNEKRFSPPPVGGISLLIVFAVLCLTVFALLSLTTVRANMRLADASVQAAADFYAADLEAQTVLARLRSGEVPEGVSMEDGVYTYACPVSETQELQVAVRVDGAAYRILRWQLVSSAGWENDESLELWDGDGTMF